MRCAAALEALREELGVHAGAMNCHVPEIRHADEPGIAPCFALGRETSRGVPWTCTGDVVTAVAMLTTTLLGGAAVYHEIESLDYRTGEVLIANSGEHDLAWCDPAQRPALVRNRWFASDPTCGACACFGPAPGPATLVAFTPHAEEASGFRFVVAEGELTGRRFPQTGTVHGAFRFGDGPVDDAWRRWAAAGANHHSSATPGHFGDDVAAVAGHLGVGCARVS
jgi:L-fucose isomerase-like protein